MNGRDHFRLAEVLLNFSEDEYTDGLYSEAAAHREKAQVHATLALAAATVGRWFGPCPEEDR